MMIHVSPIPAELTYDVRHLVLREGLPRESCYWDTDKGEGVLHLGARIEGKLAGVCTFQPEPYPGRAGEHNPAEEQENASLPAIPEGEVYRLRGMAVLPTYRGQGVGALMLLAGEDRLRRQGVGFLWCHARVGALGFYERYGWKAVGELFDIPTAGLHKLMHKPVGETLCRGRHYPCTK